jgi:RNA recognition motif-containing protein
LYFQLHDIYIPRDRDTNKPRGLAFIKMDPADADKAIAELNETTFQGRAIRVQEASSRQ